MEPPKRLFGETDINLISIANNAGKRVCSSAKTEARQHEDKKEGNILIL